MKKLSYKAKELLTLVGVVITVLVIAFVIEVMLLMIFEKSAQALNPIRYEGSTFQTLPQRQGEWDRQFEQQLERLHRSY